MTEGTMQGAAADRAADAAAALHAEVAAVRWHHQIDLGGGIVTPGYDNSARKLRRLGLPDRLDGRTVLDVGAWDGFFSFEAERRGAARVLATDSLAWSGRHEWATKRGFDLARRALGSRVEERHVDVMELSPEAVGAFDVVLFLGVLYHLRHPLLALERVASVTSGMAIVETVVDLLDVGRPAIAFYPGDELFDDATNWCAPNVPALLGMLRAAGFRRTEVVAPPRSRGFRVARSLMYRARAGRPFWSTMRTDRVVVHAWR